MGLRQEVIFYWLTDEKNYNFFLITKKERNRSKMFVNIGTVPIAIVCQLIH